MKQLTLCLFLLSAFGSAQVCAQEFSAERFRIDQTVQPKNVLQGIQDCANSDACKAVVTAAAAYIGVDASQVFAAASSIPRREGSGETFDHYFNLPAGYQMCKAVVSPISITPASGGRASKFEFFLNPTFGQAYTWTPVQGIGGGRSWVEAQIDLIGVRDDVAAKYFASGKCKQITQRTNILNCRGNPCPAVSH